jgi:hypothetical protein
MTEELRRNETLETALATKDALDRPRNIHLITQSREALTEFHRSPGRVGNVAHLRMLLSVFPVPASVVDRVMAEEAALHEGAKKWYFMRSRAPSSSAL